MHKCICGKEFEKLVSLHGHMSTCKLIKQKKMEKELDVYWPEKKGIVACSLCRRGLVARCPKCGKMAFEKVWYGWQCDYCHYGVVGNASHSVPGKLFGIDAKI